MNLVLFVHKVISCGVFADGYEVIANNSRLNPKSCGTSSISPELETSCYEWHKELTPSIMNATNVSHIEVPWIAFYFYNFRAPYGNKEILF